MDEPARKLMREPVEDVALRILRACAWRERTHLLCLNRAWAALQRSAVRDWCLELEERSMLYVPGPPPGRQRTPAEWRELLRQLRASEHVWNPQPPAAGEAAPARKVRMRVCARFRPRKRGDAAAAADQKAAEEASAEAPGSTQRVVLPLHQRLQLIRASNKCSASEAQRLLWAGGAAGNDPFSAPKGMAELALSDVTNVEPAGAHGPAGPAHKKPAPAPAADGCADAAAAHAAAASSTSAGVVALTDSSVVFCAPTIGLREFCYTAALGPAAPQPAVYEATVRQLVVDLLNGSSGCLLAFGQTGSGKTFSVSGADEAAATSVRCGGAGLGERAGLVPRALRELLSALSARRASLGIHSTLRLSAVEVFGDNVLDLLKEGEALGAWRGVAARALASGHADMPVGSAEEASALLLRAERTKRRAATAMNEHSSRAHTVLTLTLAQTSADGLELTSTLCLADLGGSEQLKRSGATGERLREAVNINLGLLALKSCVTALTEGRRCERARARARCARTRMRAGRRRAPRAAPLTETRGAAPPATPCARSHVPFHNSALTQLLRPALSGAAQAVVLVCASPDPVDASETLEALRFGELAAVVEGEARRHSPAALMAETLRALDARIDAVQAAVVAKERWEQRVETVRDERAEGLVDTGVEQKKTFRLVGAEAERAELEELLARRRELVGDAGEP